jgi:hypothetical protein
MAAAMVPDVERNPSRMRSMLVVVRHELRRIISYFSLALDAFVVTGPAKIVASIENALVDPRGE